MGRPRSCPSLLFCPVRSGIRGSPGPPCHFAPAMGESLAPEARMIATLVDAANNLALWIVLLVILGIFSRD